MKNCTLTTDNLETIGAATRERGAMAGILELWLILEPRYRQLDSVDPNAYAISSDDYRQLFDALNQGPGSGDAMYPGALSMELANIGPKQIGG